MHQSAIFFGGVLLGGVLSAACGFDLYDSSSDEIRALRVDLASSGQRSAAVQRDCERLLAAQADVRRTVDLLGADLGHFQDLHAQAEEERDTLRDSLAVAEEAIHDLERRLVDSGAAAAARERDLERLVLRYFSVPRPTSDVDLALEFLRADGTLESRRKLVTRLAHFSPEILLSLNCGPAEPRPLAGFFRTGDGFSAGSAAAIVPTSSRSPELD